MAASTSLISIHAPHEGERRKQKALWYWHHAISIHAPHEGERRSFLHHQTAFMNFNPRSPRGGATRAALRVRPWATNFNPRSPRGGATGYHHGGLAAAAISIHAPHEGERRLYAEGKLAEYIFQSTLPTRGSDLPVEARTVLIWMISIHAPHEGERPASPQ